MFCGWGTMAHDPQYSDFSIQPTRTGDIDLALGSPLRRKFFDQTNCQPSHRPTNSLVGEMRILVGGVRPGNKDSCIYDALLAWYAI